MTLDAFMESIEAAVRSTFITTRAGARHMIPRRSGVFLAFGGPGERSAPLQRRADRLERRAAIPPPFR
jgi:3-oxoacyl-[acyl-carrier protein] reductase